MAVSSHLLLPCAVVVLVAAQVFPVALIRRPGFSMKACVHMARTVIPSFRRTNGDNQEYPT